MASRVLLATLAVPISPPRNDIGDMLDMGNTAAENQRKLANLLGLNSSPSRRQLVKELVRIISLFQHWYLRRDYSSFVS